MNNTTTITIDLAKDVFQVAVFSKYGKVLTNKAISPKRVSHLINSHPEAVIYMEACDSAHYWGRRFKQLGHEVKLIHPHIVARYRNGNKNDKNDAFAIYEAARNPNIYFVTIRTLEQQDLATQHKLRAGYIKQRTQLGNRIHGFAMDYGVKFPKGIQHLRKQVPAALEDADNELTVVARSCLRQLLEQLILLDEITKEVTVTLVNQAKQIDACVRNVLHRIFSQTCKVFASKRNTTLLF
ncbi:MAG: IS110 family transposase [Candidatus Thiodiazotropha sp.]